MDTKFYGFSLLVGVIFLALITGGAIGYRLLKTDTTRLALCTLRKDIDQRIASSESFLHTHPHGIPGITAAVIRQGIDNSRRTRKALDILNC